MTHAPRAGTSLRARTHTHTHRVVALQRQAVRCRAAAAAAARHIIPQRRHQPRALRGLSRAPLPAQPPDAAAAGEDGDGEDNGAPHERHLPPREPLRVAQRPLVVIRAHTRPVGPHAALPTRQARGARERKTARAGTRAVALPVPGARRRRVAGCAPPRSRTQRHNVTRHILSDYMNRRKARPCHAMPCTCTHICPQT